jgi:hypothetical protein
MHERHSDSNDFQPEAGSGYGQIRCRGRNRVPQKTRLSTGNGGGQGHGLGIRSGQWVLRLCFRTSAKLSLAGSGKDVEARRKFIEKNALDVKNLDV